MIERLWLTKMYNVQQTKMLKQVANGKILKNVFNDCMVFWIFSPNCATVSRFLSNCLLCYFVLICTLLWETLSGDCFPRNSLFFDDPGMRQLQY